MSDYAARVRAARAYAGLTQQELAKQVGVDAATIKRREAGTQDPGAGELLLIARVCNVPVSFMEHGWAGLDENQVIRRQNEMISRLDRIEARLSPDDDKPREPLPF